MAEQNAPRKVHGDPLENVIDDRPEENQAQRQGDAQPDAIGADITGDASEQSDRAAGRGSDANGIPAFDETDGQGRKRLYNEEGASIVSRID
jgi:hypothetical protein